MNAHEPDYPCDPYDPNDEFDPNHPGSVKEFFRILKRRHDALAEQLEKIMGEMEILAYYIEKLEDNPRAFVALLMESAGRSRKTVNGHKTNHLDARHLQRGVQSVRVKPGQDGYVMVVIERQPPFLLPKRLAALLQVLAEQTHSSPDHMVGWKTNEEIARRLNQLDEKHTLPESVNNLVYRLRNALEFHGRLDKKFVEVKRNQGARFRVREVKRGPDRF